MRNAISIMSAVFIIALSATATNAADPVDNAELQKMFDADQQIRSQPDIDWKVVNGEDARRRHRVLDIINAGEVHSARDYFNAAMIFQHGATLEEARIAFGLAQTAALMEPESQRYRWLAAAAMDRMLMRAGQPQWYGTQFRRPSDASDWELYEIAEGVISDEERAAAGVADAKTQLEKVQSMNARLHKLQD